MTISTWSEAKKTSWLGVFRKGTELRKTKLNAKWTIGTAAWAKAMNALEKKTRTIVKPASFATSFPSPPELEGFFYAGLASALTRARCGSWRMDKGTVARTIVPRSSELT